MSCTRTLTRTRTRFRLYEYSRDDDICLKVKCLFSLLIFGAASLLSSSFLTVSSHPHLPLDAGKSVILADTMLLKNVGLGYGPLAIVVFTATSSVAGLYTTSTVTSVESYLTEIPTASAATYPTDYNSYSTILPSTISSSVNSTAYTSTGNSTRSSTLSTSTTTASETVLTGAARSSTTTTGSSTSTSSSARPSNTQPCNGYVEYCNRKYSNITYVAAHNSPFVVANNAASNQALDVTTQLNDGIRALTFETHKPNSTSPMMLCHTSCSELNVGTLETYLTTVTTWLKSHPYEVITIIMVNSDFVTPSNYIDPVTNSGLLPYIYTPPTSPMNLTSWPTLAEMILSNTRVVMFLDYDADQSSIPWLLEEWNYMWETPFSPTNPEFPCSVQRPPNQPDAVSRERMYMANHNLNVEINVASLDVDILVPDWVELNNTNSNATASTAGGSKEGTAGETLSNCTATWNRPMNFLLVDYYNFGNFNGSTLAVAAEANGVKYNVDSCCGKNTVASNSAGFSLRSGGDVRGLVWSLALVFVLSWYF